MHRQRRQLGFTLIELLIFLAVLSIVFTLVGLTFSAGRGKARGETFVQTLAQDINTTRSITMSQGQVYRIVLVDSHGYEIDRQTAGGDWHKVAAKRDPNVTLSGFDPGDYIVFNTRGYTRTYNPGGSSATVATLTAHFDGHSRRITITVLGLAEEL